MSGPVEDEDEALNLDLSARGLGRRDLAVHVGELGLRRLLAGELPDTAGGEAAAHAAACVDCAKRLEALREEQRSFEARLSFDRFSAGVKRAARTPLPAAPAKHWWVRPASTRSFMTVMSIGSLAAVLALVVGARPLFERARLARSSPMEGDPLAQADRPNERNRIKGGGARVSIRVAPAISPGQQRTIATEAAEPLQPAELQPADRIRIGIQASGYPFLGAISIDDRGVVTALYPDGGGSMPVPPGDGMRFLPDSLELTGTGTERLVVMLTDEPLTAARIREAAAAAFRQSGSDLRRMPKLALPGEQFHRLFIKP